MKLAEPPWFVCRARERARAREKEKANERKEERRERSRETGRERRAARDLIRLTPVHIRTTSQARSAQNMRGLVRVELGLHRRAVSGSMCHRQRCKLRQSTSASIEPKP